LAQFGDDMTSVNRTLLTTLLMVTLLGCSTTGEYMKPDDEKKVEQTVTTAAELEQKLGTPTVTVPQSDGKTMWVYEGIHKSAGVTTYIPYANLLMGYNDKNCTRLTVLVDQSSGVLSDWHYTSTKDQEYWAKTNDKCTPHKQEAALTDPANGGAKPAAAPAATAPTTAAPGS